MRKDALVITIITFVLGIFGAFFRWLQDLNAFEPETGLSIPGAGMTAAMLVYFAVALAAVLLIVFLWLKRYDRERQPEKALACRSALPRVLSWVICAVMALSGVVLMFSATEAEFPLMQRIFGACAIFAAVALPFIPAKVGAEKADSQSGVAAIIFVLFCCFWLVFSYKNNSENPIVWSYVPEILAICATMVAAYKLAGYFFAKAAPNGAIVFLQLAAILDITTLSDDASTAYKAVFICSAAVMLLYQFILIENMREAIKD